MDDDAGSQSLLQSVLGFFSKTTAKVGKAGVTKITEMRGLATDGCISAARCS
jgi:hypothetical protein